MLTGTQIREARQLLGWSRADLARNAFLPLAVVDVAEEFKSAPMLLDGQMLAIRRICEQAGVERTADADGGSGVRLREAGR